MAVTWNPSDKAAGITLSGGNLTMTSTAAASGVRGTVGFNSGKRVYGFNCTGANYLHLGVANASGLLTSPSGRFDSNGAVYRDGGGSNSFRANNNAVNVSGFGGLDGETGFVAVDITGGKFYINIGGSWGPGNPDAGTGGYDMSSIAGQTLYPYANGDDAFSPYPATVVIIDGAATGHGLSTFTPWDTASTPTVTASNASHAHSATSPTLAAKSTVACNSAAHAHSATSPTIAAISAVSPNNASHAHAATSPTISVSGAASVAPDNAAHDHSATSPSLAAASSVAPASAGHGHTVTQPTLATASTVAPQNATHDHTATSPTLAANDNAIHPANATHAHWATSPVLVSTPLDQPGYTDPRDIEGDPSTVKGRLTGGGSVVAGSIASTGRVVAGYLRGRP